MTNVTKLQTIDFEILYKKHYADLCNYAFRYLKNKNTSEDVVSETFFILWKNRTKLNNINNVKNYLYKSIHNNCLLYIRKNKPELPLSELGFQLLENVTRSEKDTLDKMILSEIEEDIAMAINKLPEQQAKVFKLKRFEDKKNKEIAEELNISVKTVEAHMSKAMQTLKKALLSYPLILISLFL